MTRPQAPGLGVALAAYRAMLRLFPRRFRDSFGGEAEGLFRDLYVEAYQRSGFSGVIAHLGRTVINTLRHGPAERWALRRNREVYQGLGRRLGPDFRFAWRTLRRAPGFTLTAVLTLALGMGATIALYSMVSGVLVQPLPYPEADRLVQLWESNKATERSKEGPSPLNVRDWRGSTTAIEDLAAWYLTSGTFRDDGVAEENRSAQVTTSFFRVLGVAPALGRDFLDDEGSPYGPLILSHPFWLRVFGGDPGVIGRTMELSGARYEVVGVMPEGFEFPDPGVQYWLAWDFDAVYGPRPETRTWRFLQTVARLSLGTRVSDAKAELSAVHRALGERYPDANRGWEVEVTRLHDEVVSEARATLLLALGAVAALLLLACANVANLLLARASHRTREVSLRQALGAGRRQLLRQLTVEHLLLAFMAGVAGLLIGWTLLELVGVMDAGQIPRLAEVAIDGPVLLFAGGLVVATSLLFGLAPAVRLIAPDGSRSMLVSGRVAGPAGDWMRKGLVAVQIGLALALLVGAGLFAESFARLRTADLGFAPSGVLTFRVSLDSQRIDGQEDIARYYDALLERLGTLPGVVSAGAAQTLPVNPVGNDFSRPYRSAGSTEAPADAATVALRIATPGYFRAAGMRFLSGGPFPAGLNPSEPGVAVINETLARRLWPGRDPVGETLEIDFRQGWGPYRVTGVIQDVMHRGARSVAQEEAYLSHSQSPYLAMSLVLRTSGDPDAVTEEARRTVLTQPPGQPGHHFVSFDDLIADNTAADAFLALFLALFAATSLVLAAAGTYGVVAYGVAARRREFGIRLALGAEAGGLRRSVTRETLALAAVGVAGGLVLVLSLGRVLESLLYQVDAWAPWTLGILSVAMLVVAALAGLLSARPITRLDPAASLRAD